MDDECGPVVASYTLAEAFEDGTLTPIPPELASVAGIEVPLVMSAGAWQAFVAGTDGGEGGRLRMVLAAVAMAAGQDPPDVVCFVVPAEALPACRTSMDADQLLAVIGPGDIGELVMTLMLPDDM